MSRVGKKLIPMPKGVKIKVGDQLTVEGPKGKQTVPVPKGITFSEKDGVLTVLRDGDDKAALHGLTERFGLNPLNCACIVDDTPDLPLMSAVGLSAAVADAHPIVLAAAHWVARSPGGSGAVRELCDVLLRARAKQS